MREDDDRAELERRLDQARRLAKDTDPLTKERLTKLVQDLEEQLRSQK